MAFKLQNAFYILLFHHQPFLFSANINWSPSADHVDSGIWQCFGSQPSRCSQPTWVHWHTCGPGSLHFLMLPPPTSLRAIMSTRMCPKPCCISPCCVSILGMWWTQAWIRRVPSVKPQRTVGTRTVTISRWVSLVLCCYLSSRRARQKSHGTTLKSPASPHCLLMWWGKGRDREH